MLIVTFAGFSLTILCKVKLANQSKMAQSFVKNKLVNILKLETPLIRCKVNGKIP
jgi:hypothetical protein